MTKENIFESVRHCAAEIIPNYFHLTSDEVKISLNEDKNSICFQTGDFIQEENIKNLIHARSYIPGRIISVKDAIRINTENVLAYMDEVVSQSRDNEPEYEIA